MSHNHNELIPDEIIDTFYNKIKKCIENGEKYDRYIKYLLKLNGKIPEKIKKLFNI